MEGTAWETPASPGGAVQVPRSRGESTGSQGEMEGRPATKDQARLPTAASFFRLEGQDGALGNQCESCQLSGQELCRPSGCSPGPPDPSAPLPHIRKDHKGSRVS